MGPTQCDGPATIYSRTPQRLRSAAPCLGEHNDFVLTELLGMSEAEASRLRDAGALGKALAYLVNSRRRMSHNGFGPLGLRGSVSSPFSTACQ